MSGCIRRLSNLHSPVFLLNSCLDLFSAPHNKSEDPLSRSYGVSLPNSLTMNLPTPQYALPGHLCRFEVRVPHGFSLADFLGSMITRAVGLARMRGRTVRVGSERGLPCIPRRLRPSTGNSVSPRRCHSSVPASPRMVVTECRPSLPSPSPAGLGLGPD